MVTPDTNASPSAGWMATGDHSDPPRMLGCTVEPVVDGGVKIGNGPPASGGDSPGRKNGTNCRPGPHSGWVGEAISGVPSGATTSEGGTAVSGQGKSGAPLSRSRM